MSTPYDPQQACLDLNTVHAVLTGLLAADKRKPLGHFIDRIERAEERLNSIRDDLAQASPPPAPPSPAPTASNEPPPPARPATLEEHREALLIALRRKFTPERMAELIAALPPPAQEKIFIDLHGEPTQRIKIIT